MQLSSLAKERHKSVDRGLPAAIDLAALCMGAGLDFPGAIHHVVENMPDRNSPVRQELERILQELALGRTRQQALQSLSERVNTESVNEFVAAVVQAEKKGTALSTVLAIQATALRGRRSVLAEEAAARAGVMLMLPMLMMMVSISLILMGPLLIDMMKGGLM
jgi:tight adherence protein C